MKPRVPLALCALIAMAAASARGASLDITTDYRMRALSYSDLNLDRSQPNNHSFLSQNARLGFMVKSISLGDMGGEGANMDVAFKLHAVGIAGSTVAFTAPFDRIASNYPNASFVPFIENAYLNIHELGGKPWDLILGRQSFRLGSGLLLDDDGAGLTGVDAKVSLPWWGMKGQAFLFDVQNGQTGSGNLDIAGFSLELPTEGTWFFNEMIEKDRRPQLDYPGGCPNGCPISRATRVFSGVGYQLNYGPLVFDGEAALEKGAATPTGPTPLPTHITYNGNAEVVRAKWKQTFYKDVRGIARLSVMHGSGANSTQLTTDGAFFPSHGHRFDGMERAGMGEFFGATPYDAFGGKSTSTASGLTPGASGILGVGFGVTPPAYHGIILDLDYFLFQADRNVHFDRNLGSEYDIRLRYAFGDRLLLSASGALFKAGSVLDARKGTARRFMLEATGRF